MDRAGTLKRTITIRAPPKAVWGAVSNIAGLPAWAAGAKKTSYLSKKRRGVGAVRLITFEDSSEVEEHVISWKAGESFTYVAVSGLPVTAYVATISLAKKDRHTSLTWQSYICARMPAKEFSRFLESMGSFYSASLGSLKEMIEKV